ncbi:hypothetical protein ACEWY4_003214 [Coilia grayii]|uniref:Ig-like domain-containing protein n=1 Tax=Coilia grayii TaxID=363190 RepID=A0ABD1KQN7_9TELE
MSTMTASLLLLMLAATCYTQGIELIQPSHMVVNPGQSVSISCKVSGFSISSYCPRWIRQPAGKPLEWIGHICSDGSSYVKDSLKSKISFTADSSSNTVFLKAQNFQTEDTAVYYCAREPYCDKHAASPHKNLPRLNSTWAATL